MSSSTRWTAPSPNDAWRTRAPCNNCDTCEAGSVGDEPVPAGPFPLGARVRHASFGEGAVQRVEDDKLVVLFDGGGYKAITLELAEDVLEAA